MVNEMLLNEPGLERKTAVTPNLYKQMGNRPFPFTTRLSFHPLIEYVERLADSEQAAEALFARQVLERLQDAPDLRRPIENESLLEQHADLVDLLMSIVFPPFTRKAQLGKASVPFHLEPFYRTPALAALQRENEVRYVVAAATDMIYCATVIGACSLILNKYYDQNIQVTPPVSMTVVSPDGRRQRHFKTQIDPQFTDIQVLGEIPSLSQDQINRLLSNIYDIELWLQHLPPENFEFSGMVLGNLIDITEEEALSRLKYSLLRKDAIVDSANIRELEQLVRTYFKMPELRLGVTAIDYPVENTVAHRYKIRFDFLAGKHEVLLADSNRNSIYEKTCKYREVLLIEDLENLPGKTPVERDLIVEGIRSIMVAPLFNQKESVIGLLEIGSSRPFELHSFTEVKFREIISLFSLAIERSREEVDNQIEAIIREQFTAVHPTVEWKFIDVAYNLLEKREGNKGRATIEPIAFHDVYPLYGQADIVSSSDKRNTAIQADLIENLRLLQRVIGRCLEFIQFPLLNQFRMKIERGISELEREFNSGDESRIVEMLHHEIHPMLENLKTSNPDLAGIVSGYFNRLDAELGIIYRKRKAYEESVALVNSTISNYLEEEDRAMQAVMPHYFEKYKTDGVEYDLYVGQSLLKHGRFCMMHLRNLRLWQLLHMCEITRRVHELQKQLPVPLTTAQLIFAYTTSLSIRFRMDEKQFDVDGAYNVRYEILKKRIDKATIEGTDERLTVDGKIAIVYLQEKDRQEYLEYIDYLRHEGYITDQVEDLRLGRLQSVQGLRALRVTVDKQRKRKQHQAAEPPQ